MYLPLYRCGVCRAKNPEDDDGGVCVYICASKDDCVKMLVLDFSAPSVFVGRTN